MDSKFRTSLNLKIFQCENSLSDWPVTLTNQRSTLLSTVRFAKHAIFLSFLHHRIRDTCSWKEREVGKF